MRESGNGNKEEWNEAIDRAKEHFAQGWQELGHATAVAKEKGYDSLKQAQIKAKETWQNAKTTGLEKWETLLGRGEEAWKDAEQAMREHPGKAVGLSVLAGMLLGVLLGRSRD